MSILNEMKELLSMIGKEFGMKYMFNPDALIEEEVLALRHPTNDNFIHIFTTKSFFNMISTVSNIFGSNLIFF